MALLTVKNNEAEILNEVLLMLEREARLRPSAMEYEMAYQIRVGLIEFDLR